MNQIYTCQYNGHEEEPIMGFCLDQACKLKSQYCNECLLTIHSTHQKNCKSMIKLKQLIKNYQTQVNDWFQYVETEFKNIQKLYQSIAKILMNEKNRLTELEKNLQNEEFQVIVSSVNTLKKINLILENSQNMNSKHLKDVLVEINDQLQSVKPVENVNNLKPIKDQYIEVKEDQFMKLEDQNIKLSEAKVEEGKKKILSGKHHDGIVCLDEAIKLNAGNSQAHLEKGLALNQLGYYQVAIQSLNEAIMLGYEDANVYYHRGEALYNLQCYEEAIQCYDQAIKLKPTFRDAYIGKGDYKCIYFLDEALSALNSLKEAKYPLQVQIKATRIEKPDETKAEGGKKQDQSFSFNQGCSQSSSSTVIRNGIKVITTKKTTVKPDGTREVVETINEGGKIQEIRYILENGEEGQ